MAAERSRAAAEAAFAAATLQGPVTLAEAVGVFPAINPMIPDGETAGAHTRSRFRYLTSSCVSPETSSPETTTERHAQDLKVRYPIREC